MECATKVRHGVKELEDINGELYYLREKLTENHKKKGEAYQRILKLKNLHHEEVRC
jgi:Mg2+ and Co2+ transporter CorA